MSSFFSELKHRKVYRAAAIYAGAAFVVWQVADIALPALGAPEWVMRFLVIGALAGFPLVLVLAWLIELRPTGARRVRNAVIGIVGLALAVGAATVVARLGLRDDSAAREQSERTLAVLPFSVRGSAGLEYLRDGLVDLLSRNLSGSDLHAVDPSAVVKAAEKSGDDVLSGEQAAAIARSVGAGQYVVGGVNQVGSVIRIHASLYALGDSVRALATGEEEGDTLELFAMVDRLTAELLAGRSPGQASRRVVRTAATTTSSIPALKLYLEGERRFRVGDHPEAIARFGEALEQDSTFALARLRRAMSHALNRSYEPAATDVARLRADPSRLTEHDRRVLDAFGAHLDGRIADAERLYRAIVRDYPADVEAKILLAALITMYSELRGTPRAEATPLLDDVAALDPEFVCISCMQQAIAYERRDYDALVRLADAQRAARGQDTTHALFVEGRRALLSQDTTLLGDYIADMLASPDSAGVMMLAGASIAMAVSQGRFDAAERLLAATRDRLPEQRAGWLAWMIASGAGRIRDAAARVDRMRRATPPISPRIHAALMVGHAPARYPELDGLRARLMEWRPPATTVDGAPDPVRPRLPYFFLGLVDARRGDPRATQWADSLERAARGATGVDSIQLADMARTIRADVAWRAGDPAEAVRLLEGLRTDLPPAVLDERSDYLYYAADLRAYVNLDAGRFDEAIRWLSYAPDALRLEYNHGDWHLAMARALDGAGRPDEAAEHYARVLHAWADADPELQPKVDYARRRLTAIRVE